MWQYSEILMDHFMNPRNVGNLDNPDGHSEVGSPQCGDAMFLDIDIDDQGRIGDIAFKTFGCAGAIASASALTEMCRGLPVEEALKIRNSQIAEYLGGMPPEKFHCSVMGHQALKDAVKDFNTKCDEISAVLASMEISPILVRPGRVYLKSGDDVEAVERMLKEKIERNILVEVK
ncbi:MAG: iron-sulfur cluster assembly scaffold protein [Candidatus Fermentibacteria bacterium]|nr:iron-sulfur cluster assembly scaffold protein [Candidatus Fermentibacteria bacterium]